MMYRTATLACFALLLCGCDSPTRIVTPTPISLPPSQAPPPGVPTGPYWTANATVISVTGTGGCGWGRTPGETRSIAWLIEISGKSILLDEDMGNWPTDDVPYRGSFEGGAFTATYDQGPDYLRWVCQFKGGTLSGTFSANQLTFEAMETLIWGPPDSETRVQRRWVGSRFPN